MYFNHEPFRCANSLFLLLSMLCAAPAYSAPTTFLIPHQPQFDTFVSGFLTFDPSGIYFAGPFQISIGDIPNSSLPADEFTDSSTFYVIQPNTSFHSLWVFNAALPFDHLFLFLSFGSCNGASCTFNMTYYESQCSDCPPSAIASGSIHGVRRVTEPLALNLFALGLLAVLAIRVGIHVEDID
jgi:hypothetical protein